MSDIPRWKIPPGYVDYHGAGLTDVYVEVVTYADAVRWRDEAVAAAVLEVEHGMEAIETMQLGLAYIKGQQDAEDAEPLWPSEERAYQRGIKAARDAVEALPYEVIELDGETDEWVVKYDALAAIDGLAEGAGNG